MKTHSEFFKRFFLFGLLLLFSLSNCTDSSPIIDTRSETESTPAPTCNYDQYTKYGDQFYEHFKYDFEYVAPEKILPEQYRDLIMNTLDSFHQVIEGWEFQDVLDYYEAEGILSSDLSQNLSELDSIGQEFISGSINIQETVLAIQTLTNQKTASSTISCLDKNYIVTVNSIVERLTDYFIETGGISFDDSIAQNRGCPFLAAFGCFFSTSLGWVTSSIIPALAIGGLVSGIAGAQAGMVAFVATLAAAALVGSIDGLVVALDEDKCCPGPDCRAIMGISIKHTDCNGNAEYKAFGFGSDDVSLTWANTGGVPAAALTLVATPTINVTQNAANVPLVTTVTSNCDDGSTRTPNAPFIRNLFQLSKEIRNVSLTGTTEVDPESGETYNYVGLGIPANLNYSTQWHVTNGTITSSNVSEALVIWDENMTTGEIKLVVQNNCPSGQIKEFKLTVVNGGDIP